MPAKRVMLTNDALERPKAARRGGESISDVVVRLVPKKVRLEGFLDEARTRSERDIERAKRTKSP
jgi:predicted CopG family antitoxin